jgi:hypothetical protein
MDQNAAGWSVEDISLLLQTLGQQPTQQFVREHPHLQRVLHGWSTRLPPHYVSLLANPLAQRSPLAQQTLKELLKLWRQKHQPLCEAIERLEPPLTLEALAPLIEEHGGNAVLSALHLDPRAETLGETRTALKEGIGRKAIPAEAQPAPGRDSGKPAKSGNTGTQASSPGSGAAPHKESAASPASTSAATLPRPSGGLARRAASTGAPKTTNELFAALEAELHTLQTIQQTITTSAAQLAQTQTADDAQMLQRALDKLNAAYQKRLESFARFAALNAELLEKLQGETQQAEASGQVEGLSASLPSEAAPTTIHEASERIQALQQVRDRLNAALTQNEQHLAALKAAPAAIETLLHQIEELRGESGSLRASLASLKADIPAHADARRVKPALQVARALQAQATAQRDQLIQDWRDRLQRAYQDSESLLNQSLHLSADLPEITNLQHTLQEAIPLLETLVAPQVPTPLPFPPGHIISCYEALGQCGEQLRRTLANYTPQIALATLHEFEQSSFTELTAQQLQKVGAALVGAAALAEGYSGLIWRVGATILAALDNAAAEQFYERYGFAAVAMAIVASLRAGDFPLGLTFAEKDYLFYTDAEIASVFKHERVLGIIRDACAADAFPPLPPDCFAHASPAVRQAARQLLARASQIGLPEPLPLQLSAALLDVAATQEERAEAGRILIQNLLDHQQHLNAYCVWRALALEQTNLYSDSTGLDALYGLIWRLSLATNAPGAQLAAICGDVTLQEVSSFVPGVALALALGSLSLAHSRYPHGEEWALFFLDMLRDHHHYLAVSDALRARLPKAVDEPVESDDTTDQRRALQAQFSAALAEANRRIQGSNYRFAPTKQMRNQIDALLKPLLTALQQGLAPTGELGASLHDADPLELARMLIQDAEKIRRQEGRDPIEGNDLKKLRKDLENLLKHLIDAAARRAELVAQGIDIPAVLGQAASNGDHAAGEPEEPPADQHWEIHESLYPELRRLLGEVPQANDLLQRALPDISFDLS